MTKSPKDIGASVRARLLRLARGAKASSSSSRATRTSGCSIVSRVLLLADAPYLRQLPRFVEEPLAAAATASTFGKRWAPGETWA